MLKKSQNKADPIDNQDEPSCAVIDKLHVPCFVPNLLGHVFVAVVVPPAQPTVGLSGLGAAGLQQQGGPEQGWGGGVPSMNVHKNVNSSFSHQQPAPPPEPIASRGQKNRRWKNTLHKSLCNAPQKLVAESE